MKEITLSDDDHKITIIQIHENKPYKSKFFVDFTNLKSREGINYFIASLEEVIANIIYFLDPSQYEKIFNPQTED